MRPFVSVKAVPLLQDNYGYVIFNAAHNTAVLVDPAEPAKCLDALPAGAELCGSLTTHHHRDHSGGNLDLAAARPGLPIAGGSAEEGRIEGATLLLGHGQSFEMGGMAFTALHTPCHTKGHLCYYLPPEGEQAGYLFSGDTIFAGGCGRFFEGDARQMLSSFATVMALPPSTRLYAGHEYTLANLRFGQHVEPGNERIRAWAAACKALAEAGKPTLPSTLATEAVTNVFLRTREDSVRAFTHPGLTEEQRRALTDVEVLAALREAKNAFK